ncbi:fructokinase [Evansella caseinilytica]|uniref:Fructokinase n=1 Tax=Evansella caseinilytica TaxID=1503961 RepID=A0A1H3UXX3_9BACI|nr:aminoimidazole riboside kinase [Evansella caseinilytica]SDZ66841.1 fructokinase [Evansella caseinilytica]
MANGIVCLGEALIDFIPLDDNNETYQKSPGGAPANVAVGCARLGARSSFLGKIGDDVLGNFLVDTLNNYQVDTSHLFSTKAVRTGAVFVTLGDGGERSFEFYIDPSADRFLEVTEVEAFPFVDNRVLHFGSISMISEPAKSATIKAVEIAKENGLFISYDPNLRLSLWESEAAARDTIISMLPKADVLKISEEELEFLTGEKDVVVGAAKLDAYNIPLIFITLGAEGSYVFLKGSGHIHVPAMKVKAVDTTGAGDAFVSGILFQLNQLQKDIEQLTLDEVKKMARFAAVSGGLAASTKGAMTALPTLPKVEATLKEQQ